MSAGPLINYIELPSHDLVKTKDFFRQVFAWEFIDYGDSYTAFSNAGIDGGFYLSSLVSRTENGAGLIVFYSESLATIQAKIEQYGGIINKAIYSFPGGRRFHFLEPCGSEFAVWSDKN
jgi:predicted enzyme related to lactoylglutathione lyase